MLRRTLLVGSLLFAAVFLWPLGDELLRQVPGLLYRRSPHDQYRRNLGRAGLDKTEEGRAWLAAAHAAIEHPAEGPPVFSRSGVFDGARQGAYGWRFPVRRGQRVVITAAFGRGRLFIDLLERDGRTTLASAAAGSTTLTYDVKADAQVIARLQPEVSRGGPYRLMQRANATLLFPVSKVSPSGVQSTFGGARDAGRRRHEGIDIFAPRGTPVVAATGGWITAQTSNALGGNVVWIWSLRPRIATYYAHLDRQAVSPGDRVRAGEVIGYVGNTGNARGTAPHLHFGLYAPPAGAVDPLPFVCDAPCGERLMQRPRRENVGS